MKQFLFAAGAFGLIAAAVATAQNPTTQPAQPVQPGGGKGAGGGQPGGGQPSPWGPTTRVTPAKMSELEEDF